MIDWQDIVNGWNEHFKTNFKDDEEMLRAIYLKPHGTTALGKKIGVAASTLLRRLRHHNIPVRGKGGPNFRTGKNAQRLKAISKELPNMTLWDIRSFLRNEHNTVIREKNLKSLLKRHNYQYKKSSGAMASIDVNTLKNSTEERV